MTNPGDAAMLTLNDAQHTVRGIPVEDHWPPGGAMIKVHGAGVNDRYAGVVYPAPDGSWTADLWAETCTIPVEPQAGTCRRRAGLASRDDAEEYVREVLASDGPWYLAVPSSTSRRPGCAPPTAREEDVGSHHSCRWSPP
jgi:hypothetical protein